MEASNFDFTQTYTIDFNVDFDVWPPPAGAFEELVRRYQKVDSIEPSGGDSGHFQFRIVDRATYSLVMRVQAEATQLARKFGGRCDTWGVWTQPIAE